MKKEASFLIFLSFSIICYGRIIELDTESNSNEEFFDISCDYAEAPADFGNFGSPCAVSDEDIAAIGDTAVGFWTPCKEVRHLNYYGGMLPSPKSITVRVYWNDTEGTTSLKLTGKTSPISSENDTRTIENFSMQTQGWNIFPVDTSAHISELFVYTVEVSRTANRDTILIDKVTIDLGEEVIEPTDPPTTTSSPVEDGIVTLDTENDLVPEWIMVEHECVYSYDHDDFANAWGCPAPLEEDGIVTSEINGYWSPCQKSNCSLVFNGESVPQIKFIAIQAFLKGLGAELIISGKESISTPDFEELHRVHGSDQGLISQPIGYSLTSNIKVLNFTLVSNGNGYIVLDKMFLAQEEIDLPNPTTYPPGEQTTSPPEEETTSPSEEETTSPPGEQTTTPSGAKILLAWEQASVTLLMSIFLKYLL